VRFAGICWFLLITRTTLSVPVADGRVMCMGVATANSILMVHSRVTAWIWAYPAASGDCEAGYTAMRPVIMTRSP